MSAIRSWRGDAGLQYRWRENLEVSLRYTREQQRSQGAGTAAVQAERNRVVLGVAYGWTRPLGR